MTSTLSDVEIGWRTQLSNEVRPYAIDLSDALDVSDAVASATATLTDLLDGSAYPTGISGTPTTSISAPHVTVNVTSLVAGRSYRLVVLVNVGGSKRTGVALLLRCPY